MSRADLPALVGLTALSLGHAVLTLEDGSSVEVKGEGGASIWLFGLEPPFTLIVGQSDAAHGCQVPPHLEASVCAALNLFRPESAPPVLTLLSISKAPDAVTFAAVNQEGQPVSLTMPRPAFVRPGFPMPRPVGVPVNLSVTREDTPPGQGFTFQVYPDTPEGRAALELLGYAERVDASGEGKA